MESRLIEQNRILLYTIKRTEKTFNKEKKRHTDMVLIIIIIITGKTNDDRRC
jgi:hypothetical protein